MLHCKNRAVLQAHTVQVTAGPGDAVLLDGVSISLQPGRMVVVAGPNGSGKSTLVRALSRVLQPRTGKILLDDRDLYTFIDTRSAARAIAVVPQETQIAFDFTAHDVVAMGRTPYQSARSVLQWETAADRDAVARAMNLAGVSPELHTRPVRSLSGGERQRVLIARAWAQDADVLLFDEPTAALDLRHQTAVLETLRDLAHGEGRSVLVVLHDLNLAAEYADEIILLKDGRIAAQGAPQDVITNQTVRAVYGAHVWVRCHPVSGKPYLLSMPELPDLGIVRRELDGVRIHLLCGGGTGAPIMTRMALAGADVSTGPLSAGDTDEDIAEVLGVAHRRIPSFTAVPPLDQAEQDALTRECDVCLVTDVPFGDGNLETLCAALMLAEHKMRVLVVQDAGREFSERDFTTNGRAGELWARLLQSPQTRLVAGNELWDALVVEVRRGRD